MGNKYLTFAAVLILLYAAYEAIQTERERKPFLFKDINIANMIATQNQNHEHNNPEQNETGEVKKLEKIEIKPAENSSFVEKFIVQYTANKITPELNKQIDQINQKIDQNTNPEKVTKLELTDIKIGDGERAVKIGDKVKIKYDITLTNGRSITEAREKNAPLEFTVGKKSVIEGFEKTVIGMKQGGVRKAKIPSNLAYDNPKFKSNKIPENSDLEINIEVLEIGK